MIYLDYWGMSRPPFANTHLPETFVPTQSSGVALAKLRYALGTRQGAAGLIGNPGTGKTIVARMIVDEFQDAGWLAVYMPQPGFSADDLLGALAPNPADWPAGCSGQAALGRYLKGLLDKGRMALAAIDDVQAARDPLWLEWLRTLLNIEKDGERALAILLAGQPPMERRLAAASGFDSQLSVRAVLEPMTREETKVYILSRLQYSGTRHGIFTRQAAERLAEISGGVPRQVNRLCELSLMTGYGLGVKKIDPALVNMAAADLDLLPGEDMAFHDWPAPEARPKPEPEPSEPESEEDDILASLGVEDGK